MKNIVYLIFIVVSTYVDVGFSFFKKHNIKLDIVEFSDKIQLDKQNIFDLNANEGACKVKNDSEANIFEIQERIMKKNILDLLVNEKIYEKRKIEIIEYNNYLIYKNSKIPILYCGGLMNDWETNIFE